MCCIHGAGVVSTLYCRALTKGGGGGGGGLMDHTIIILVYYTLVYSQIIKMLQQ